MRSALRRVPPAVLAALMVVLAAVAPGLVLAPSHADADDAPTASETGRLDLKYRPSRTWRYELPAESFVRVGGAIDFSGVGGARFATAVEGSGLEVDTDGDGTTDVKIEGEGGYVRLRTEDGFDYSVRLRNAGAGWTYAASGARVTKLGNVRITLIDQDGDGRYDGYGRDAMIVGSSRVACFLSRVINVAGTLHRIDVAADGSSLRHAPYGGAAGRIDLARRWDARARLRSAIVRSEDGAYSFDLAAHADGLAVPAGRYRIHGGSLALGDSHVRFRQGKAAPVDVKAEHTVRVPGGGPLRAEFAWQRRGDELLLSPESLRWFGRAGEEYYGWAPFGSSPEFTITDMDAKQEVAKAIFTGC